MHFKIESGDENKFWLIVLSYCRLNKSDFFSSIFSVLDPIFNKQNTIHIRFGKRGLIKIQIVLDQHDEFERTKT